MYKRRKSSVVFIGNTPMGGDYPIRVQSMTNTSTLATDESIRQCIRIIDAGGEYVRLTAQGVREAENLKNIKEGLRKLAYQTPLIADIHFNPKAAETAAKMVEKVRINPGNFVDPVKTFKKVEYTEEEYRKEIEKIRQRFIPLLNICKAHNTVIRIGVNHGSLSDRIMSRYGDTPEGMVESCLEFLRICVSEQFLNVVISIKASSTFIMVKTVRLLVRRMDEEGMKFPLHLGVTEAGDGEDGRIKSAVGIGALLLEGIGDTIRVSLSEDPELEIPVAQTLLNYIREKETGIKNTDLPGFLDFEERKTRPAGCIGGPQTPVVISDCSHSQSYAPDANLTPDFLYLGKNTAFNPSANQKVIIDFPAFTPAENHFPLFTLAEKTAWLACDTPLQFIRLSDSDVTGDFIELLRRKPQTVVILSTVQANNTWKQKTVIRRLSEENRMNPVIIHLRYREKEPDVLRIKAATDAGSFFFDRLADGLFLQNETETIATEIVDSCSFGILQATGRRISKTEYIACPSCGRTLFDLQSTLKKIKTATIHLKGLKIGVMGCIVNGPGEMADADYGYVGAGAGRVSLYKGKECVKKHIPEAEAVDELLRLIQTSENKKL